jgi:hypothetical protein
MPRVVSEWTDEYLERVRATIAAAEAEAVDGGRRSHSRFLDQWLPRMYELDLHQWRGARQYGTILDKAGSARRPSQQTLLDALHLAKAKLSGEPTAAIGEGEAPGLNRVGFSQMLREAAREGAKDALTAEIRDIIRASAVQAMAPTRSAINELFAVLAEVRESVASAVQTTREGGSALHAVVEQVAELGSRLEPAITSLATEVAEVIKGVERLDAVRTRLMLLHDEQQTALRQKIIERDGRIANLERDNALLVKERDTYKQVAAGRQTST